ncbi:MAG: BrnT family toxin [Elusimicrobiota bacterium]|nr:BrnT family toxin [Elusimicrobiota bacterium]
MSLLFEWDKKKAKRNFEKHKVNFEEATTIFGDPNSITIKDTIHSMDEERFISIGRSIKSRLIVAVHCERQDRIRIISARKATYKERRTYEE